MRLGTLSSCLQAFLLMKVYLDIKLKYIFITVKKQQFIA